MQQVRPLAEPLDRPIRLGVLISGGGTTLMNFLDKIEVGELDAEVAVVIASRAGCAGLERAAEAGLKTVVVPRRQFTDTESFSRSVFDHLREARVDLVTLAGFLSLLAIPDDFQYRIMNIHPGLIPAFCGKGFYGGSVHQAAIQRGVKVSGCTVHFADNIYDHGPIIVQQSVSVLDGDTPESLAARIFTAECEAFPEAIRLFASGRLVIEDQRVRLAD